MKPKERKRRQRKIAAKKNKNGIASLDPLDQKEREHPDYEEIQRQTLMDALAEIFPEEYEGMDADKFKEWMDSL